MVCLIVACNTKNPVTEEIVSYINGDLKQLSEEEVRLNQAYESVTGNNSVDDETTYNKLSDEIIPGYVEYIKKVEAVNIKSQELKDVHEIYIEAINIQHSALTIILSGLENGDYDKIDEANTKLTEARKMMRDYQSELTKLMDKYHVKKKE